MSTIENYIYVKNHIPTEVCESLIDECNKKEWQKHTWNNYVAGTSSSDVSRISLRRKCTSNMLVEDSSTIYVSFMWGDLHRYLGWMGAHMPHSGRPDHFQT